MAAARSWLWATIALTAGAIAVAIALAPPATAPPGAGLAWVLFVASSGHVASTAWAYCLPDVRAHVARHRWRYAVVPAILVLAAAALAVALPPRAMTWLLLPYFGWQFFHFQKQNLGLAALAASSSGVPGLSKPERTAILATGWTGIAGLVARPSLLQVEVNPHLGAVFPGCAIAYGVAVITGVGLFLRRPRPARPAGLAICFLTALLFFVPVFAFTSPYAAVGGLTIAHGAQYLLLMGHLAWGGGTGGGSTGGVSRVLQIAVLVNIVLIGGTMLEVASHADASAGVVRSIYGAYLGIVMSHFVVDAGLWRLRDAFPRRFLAGRVPYLLRPAMDREAI